MSYPADDSNDKAWACGTVNSDLSLTFAPGPLSTWQSSLPFVAVPKPLMQRDQANASGMSLALNTKGTVLEFDTFDCHFVGSLSSPDFGTKPESDVTSFPANLVMGPKSFIAPPMSIEKASEIHGNKLLHGLRDAATGTCIAGVAAYTAYRRLRINSKEATVLIDRVISNHVNTEIGSAMAARSTDLGILVQNAEAKLEVLRSAPPSQKIVGLRDELLIAQKELDKAEKEWATVAKMGRKGIELPPGKVIPFLRERSLKTLQYQKAARALTVAEGEEALPKNEAAELVQKSLDDYNLWETSFNVNKNSLKEVMNLYSQEDLKVFLEGVGEEDAEEAAEALAIKAGIRESVTFAACANAVDLGVQIMIELIFHDNMNARCYRLFTIQPTPQPK